VNPPGQGGRKEMIEKDLKETNYFKLVNFSKKEIKIMSEAKIT
jgi:hypothetical protein